MMTVSNNWEITMTEQNKPGVLTPEEAAFALDVFQQPAYALFPIVGANVMPEQLRLVRPIGHGKWVPQAPLRALLMQALTAPRHVTMLDCPLCDQASCFTCEECDGRGKINVSPPAPTPKNISTWRERIGQPADFPLHVPTDVERAMVAEIADLRATAVAGSEPTEISAQLRDFAGNPGYSHNDYADVMRRAADECDRFYNGMLAWKKTAHKKDADAQSERMGRVNDRIKSRAAVALEDLIMQHRIAIAPEYEGGFHAYIYRDQDAALNAGYGATPREAVDIALAAPLTGKTGGAA
jgi:hypothetical protein